MVASSFFFHYMKPAAPGCQRIVNDVSKICKVSLRVDSLLGEEVSAWVDSEVRAGYYEVRWEAGSFSSSIYFYGLQAGDPSLHSGQWFVETKRLLLLK